MVRGAILIVDASKTARTRDQTKTWFEIATSMAVQRKLAVDTPSETLLFRTFTWPAATIRNRHFSSAASKKLRGAGKSRVQGFEVRRHKL
jgi:hypothetical protein